MRLWPILAAAGLILLTPQALSAADYTYHRDIAPIMERHCIRCHKVGEIGPMPLATYEQVKQWSPHIRAAISVRKMPADQSGEHNRRFYEQTLKERDMSILLTWIDAGMPEGKKEKR